MSDTLRFGGLKQAIFGFALLVSLAGSSTAVTPPYELVHLPLPSGADPEITQINSPNPVQNALGDVAGDRREGSQIVVFLWRAADQSFVNTSNLQSHLDNGYTWSVVAINNQKHVLLRGVSPSSEQRLLIWRPAGSTGGESFSQLPQIPAYMLSVAFDDEGGVVAYLSGNSSTGWESRYYYTSSTHSSWTMLMSPNNGSSNPSRAIYGTLASNGTFLGYTFRGPNSAKYSVAWQWKVTGPSGGTPVLADTSYPSAVLAHASNGTCAGYVQQPGDAGRYRLFRTRDSGVEITDLLDTLPTHVVMNSSEVIYGNWTWNYRYLYPLTPGREDIRPMAVSEAGMVFGLAADSRGRFIPCVWDLTEGDWFRPITASPVREIIPAYLEYGLWPLGMNAEGTILARATHLSKDYAAQLQPLLDSDRDSLPDDWELANGLDPYWDRDGNLFWDTDSDELTSFGEYQAGTNPSIADTDSDGIPDGWEVRRGYDPRNAADAAWDLDGDRLTTLREFQIYTDPGAHYEVIELPSYSDPAFPWSTGPLLISALGNDEPLTLGTWIPSYYNGEDYFEFGLRIQILGSSVGEILPLWVTPQSSPYLPDSSYISHISLGGALTGSLYNVAGEYHQPFVLPSGSSDLQALRRGPVPASAGGALLNGISPVHFSSSSIADPAFGTVQERVVGTWFGPNWFTRGFLWKPAVGPNPEVLQDIFPSSFPLGCKQTEGVWISPSGTIYGNFIDTNAPRFDYHAFLFDGTNYRFVTLPGESNNSPSAPPTPLTIRGVNSHGDILGTKYGQVYAEPDDVVFLWKAGDAQPLWFQPMGRTNFQPYAFNDRRQVVGRGTTRSGQDHAFLWQELTFGGVTFQHIWDLNSLIPASSPWEIYSPTAINNRGDIAAYALKFDSESPEGRTVPVLLRPVINDSDSDGLPDDWERAYFHGLIGLYDGSYDPDGDGVVNSIEFELGMNPMDPSDGGRDTDDDGMPDVWERANGLNLTNPDDASEDADGDGLSNLDEFTSKTNPWHSDSDTDGLSDSEELVVGTDPQKADSDEDGVSDGEDAYPLVKGASQIFPVRRYVAIDLPTQANAGRLAKVLTSFDGVVSPIGLNDANQVGMVFWTPGISLYKVVTWKGGTFKVEGTFSSTISADGRPATLECRGVTGDGTVVFDPIVTTHNPSNNADENFGLSAVVVGPGKTPPPVVPWPSSHNPTFTFTMGVTDSGLVYGYDDNGDWGNQAVVDGIIYPELSPRDFDDGCPDDDYLQYLVTPDHPDFAPIGPSGGNMVFGSLGGDYSGNPRVPAVWFTGGVAPAPARGLAASAYPAAAHYGSGGAKAFGWASSVAGAPNGTLDRPSGTYSPFYYESGVQKDFYSLLPSAIRMQIKFSGPVGYPSRISMNSAGDLFFRAQIYDPSQAGGWRKTDLIYTRVTQSICEVEGLNASFPPDGRGFNANQLFINSQGLHCPIEVEYLSRELVLQEQPLIQLPGTSLYESDCPPDVKLTCQSATLDPQTGQLNISVSCVINDYASGLQNSTSGRLNEVKFIVDGQVFEANTNLSNDKRANVIPIWNPHGEEIVLNRTFIIPQPHAGIHTVVALTGENPSLRQGWDSVAVSLGFDNDGQLTVKGTKEKPLRNPPPIASCPVVCRVKTSPGVATWLTGPNAPAFRLAGREVKLVQSSGISSVDGESSADGLVLLYVADPSNPVGGGDEPRVFFFAENSSDLAWAESQPSWELEMQLAAGAEWQSLDQRQIIFLSPEDRVAGENTLQSRGTAPLAGNNLSSSSTGRTLFAPRASSPEAPRAPALAQSAVSWGYEEFFFWLELIYGPVERRVAESIHDDGHLDIVPINAGGGIEMEHHLGTDPEPYLVKVDSGFKTPCDAAVAFHQAITSNWNGKIDYAALRLSVATPEEIAEETDRARKGFADFAASLSVAVTENLIRITPYTGGGIMLDINEGMEEWERGNQKAAGGMVGVNVISAVISHRLKAGKSLHINTKNGVEIFEDDAAIALGTAAGKAVSRSSKGLIGRVEALRDLERHIAAGKLSPAQMDILIQSGLFARENWSRFPAIDLPPPWYYFRQRFESYDVLGHGILKANGKIPVDAAFDEAKAWRQFSKFFKNHRRHHDLPNGAEFRDFFLRVGLDPNDGEHFGRAVVAKWHNLWHKPKHKLWIDGVETTVNFGEGGPFNAAWRTFRAEHQNATASDIRGFLTDLRTDAVRIDFDDGRAFLVDFSNNNWFNLIPEP